MIIMRVLCLPLLLVSLLAMARPENIYDPSRDAFSDFHHSLKSASLKNKNILIIAGGNWCSFCYKLERDLKESSLDKVIASNFILMKANIGDGNDNEAFFSLFPEFNTYPHIMIISTTGKLLESIPVPSTEQAFRDLLTKYTIETRTDNKPSS